MSKAGINDCAKKYAEKVNISVVSAKKIFEDVIDVLEDVVVETGGVQFTKRFSIVVAGRKAREGRNPQTGDAMSIPASNSLKISTGTRLKERLNSK